MICIFERQVTVEDTETQRSSICQFILQWSCGSQAGPHRSLQCGWQDAKYSVASPGALVGIRPEVKQPRHKQVPIWMLELQAAV